MTPTQVAPQRPFFEIDHPDEFGRFVLNDPQEVIFYLGQLARRSTLLTAHVGSGELFFLTRVLAVDAENGSIFIEPAEAEKINTAATACGQLTLVANLDRIKVQFRIAAPHERPYAGQRALCSTLPASFLRLQRRELFRLEPPVSQPLFCRLTASRPDGSMQALELRVMNISGGGLSLNVPTELADDFTPATVFTGCRLDLPGEGVVLVSIRTHKPVEFSDETGRHHLRVGCEFIGLSPVRLAKIDHYIARIERERSALHAAP